MGADRRGAANGPRRVAHKQATELEVTRAVAQAYFLVAADEAVVASANARRDTAKANLDDVTTRNAAGVAPELDLRRAAAELESARQDVTEAEYQLRVARRSLATTAGIQPSPGTIALGDDLAPEPPLETFGVTSAHPSIRAATETARAAEADADATRAGLYPRIAATATERITNATGFGQPP